MKKQNGITLVAMIVTIIVLLVIAVVSMNAALGGRLFGLIMKIVKF